MTPVESAPRSAYAGVADVRSQNERYSRQILFRPIGQDGQARIRNATVAVVGCGALGSFQVEAMARAGIGKLRIVDRDYVDYSNLQRQWLFDEADARTETPKAIAAEKRVHQLNGDVLVDSHVSDLTPSNVEELLHGCDLILDGTDNFETRFLLNDFSVKTRTPWIYGAAVESYGVVMPVVPGRGPCLACVYPDPPGGMQPTCDVVGVISPATASVAALQVGIALRIIVGWPDFCARVHTIDVWGGGARQMSAGAADAECAVCGRREFAYLDGKRAVPVSLCGRNAVQLHENARPLELSELAERLSPLGEVRHNEFALRVRLSRFDVTFFPDGRAIIKGTTDPGVARSVYTQLVGG